MTRADIYNSEAVAPKMDEIRRNNADFIRDIIRRGRVRATWRAMEILRANFIYPGDREYALSLDLMLYLAGDKNNFFDDLLKNK